MTESQLLRVRYGQLCTELGHLYSNKNKIEKRIAEVEAEIAAIDRISEIPKKPQIVEEPKK